MTILDHYLLIESITRDPAHAALFDTSHRVCQHALASHLMLINEQLREARQRAGASDPQPVSWPAPRPEAPPDVI